MRRAHCMRRGIVTVICCFSAACNIPPSVWQALANTAEFDVTAVSIAGPDEIPDGTSATYDVTVVFKCASTGSVDVIRELWDSDLPPFDPDELLSWRKDLVLCQPPPNETRDTRSLTLSCRNGDVWGQNARDPDGRRLVPDSGEGTGLIVPGAEIFGRSQGSHGPARRSGEKRVQCI